MSQFTHDIQAIDLSEFRQDAVADPRSGLVGVSDGMAVEFEAYLADPSMQVQPVGEPEAVSIKNGELVTNPLAMEKSGTLGDKVLNMLGEVKGQIDDNFSRLADSVEKVDPNSIKDLTELQYEVMRFSFELNMSSKIASESTQHIDRFLNQQ